MNLFQILAIAVFAILIVVTLVGAIRGSMSRRDGLIWSIVWTSAGLFVVRPDLTVTVAKLLGIGRGADLLLYCAVVVSMIGFLAVYIRLRRLRREMTLVVRHLAIRDAVAASGPTPCAAESDGGAPSHTSDTDESKPGG